MKIDLIIIENKIVTREYFDAPLYTASIYYYSRYIYLAQRHPLLFQFLSSLNDFQVFPVVSSPFPSNNI